MASALAQAAEVSSVRSGDVTLAVEQRGDRSAPTVVLVHGYPDSRGLWSLVAERLEDCFHVVIYDVRGAGESSAPSGTGGYALAQLAGDAAAVFDAVAPDRRVHLVGHDWGAMAGWAMLSDPRTAGRIASFAAISGPPLDHMGDWLRRRVTRPTPAALRAVAGQARRSSYMLALGVPGLAERVWPRLIAGRWRGLMTRVEHARVDAGWPAPSLAADGGRGANLYRANVPRQVVRPGRSEPVRTPVLVVRATGDRFIHPDAYDGIAARYPTAVIRDVAGGHWVPRTQPDLLSGWIADQVKAVEQGSERPGRAAAAAQVHDPKRPLDGQLAVVTGAGSGIGQATAVRFAQAGARLVLVDLNEGAAAETARVLDGLVSAGAGSAPDVIAADVGDLDAMEAVAERIGSAHGAADIVVNNAGIAIGGSFFDTELEDWERLLRVNLWGVIHGCLLLGRQMVARGQGGQIVNVASAAAFQPSQAMAAYCTSKSAVLMLSECLRAELAGYGIGVTAICPGLIDTPITRAATYVGRTEAEQEQIRERVSALYARRNYTADQVAERVLRAVLNDEAVVPVSPEASVIYALSRLAPAVLRRMARIDPLPG